MKGDATETAGAGSLLGSVRRIRADIGAWAQFSVVQYFLAETLVIGAWAGPEPYSRATGLISDLGARYCGVYDDRAVCSPLHDLMNASFVVQGLALIFGAVFLTAGLLSVAARPGVEPQRFRLVESSNESSSSSGNARLVAPPWIMAVAVRILTGVAGVGTVLVGLVPEDLHSPWHFAGALMFFGGGAVTLLLLGILWFRQTAVSWFLGACGTVSLAALVTGGLTRMDVPQPGTLERLMGYPVTVGLAVAGLVIARRVHRGRREARSEAQAAI